MSEALLTHADLARAAGVSVTSIKSYRSKFPGFIPVASWTKPLRFAPGALPVCVRIRELFGQGQSVAQVRRALAAEFPEQEQERPAEEAGPGLAAGVSEEHFQEFFRAAGKMMQGMAALATAQARAEQRLSRLERALEANALALSELTSALQEQARRDARPRKVVAVRGSQGTSTYTLEERAAEPAEEPVHAAPEHGQADGPPESFLSLPVAIVTERGEYLGVHGRPPLSTFTSALEAQGAAGSWGRTSEGFAFSLSLGGIPHVLRFESRATPSGLTVALLTGLDLDGKSASPGFIQEFVRKMREKMA